MAAAAVMPAPAEVKRNWTPIITAPAVSNLGTGAFDASQHLAFKETPKVYTMKEIGLAEDTGISHVAVSEPFPLFTEEAVMRMRQEVLSPEVLSNCQYSSNLAQCQLRGFANKYAPFVYDVWKSPETLAIISKVAGIDLVTEMDFEIGHINISVKSEKEKEEELQAFNDRAQFEADEGIAGCPWEDDKPIVDWHMDSYPFVCVTMLSDCTTMIGGETALRTGNGDIMKVRGPQMGCAVVLQGRYIEHQALRALGTAERISMVTSFRPRSWKVRDDTVLTTVRPISNLPELYNQFSEYRLEILEERVRQQLKELREANSAGRKVATRKLKSFLEEQEKFLAHMNREMIDDENVMMGSIDDSGGVKKSEAATAKKGEAKSKKRPRRF
ncbi:hypothetical protein F4781DRAFT_396811 [Annulohypoxylon bovei var. microspora]|nr:hypothetical protein F4781DRAFT_396811 [Annulohypoxylon bovei var. microspora]